MTRAALADYDTDPERWRTNERLDAHRLGGGDLHGAVAARLVAEGCRSVLDVGCGDGRLRRAAPPELAWTGCDYSPTMLAASPRPVVRGDALRLPFGDATFDAVTALYMLYHFDRPADVIAEAWRVLRPGGLFAACAPSRDDSPELRGVAERAGVFTFDAENGLEQVRSVFASVREHRWDRPLYELPDAPAARDYARGLGLRTVGDFETLAYPLAVTKRGALFYGRKAA